MVKSVENKPVEVSKSQIAATAKKAMLRIVFWVLFLGILYGLWLNPQIITNMVHACLYRNPVFWKAFTADRN
jgi:hypothetical protein